MSFDLDSISKGAGLRAPRIVLLGTQKIGKSTFAASSHRPIFIPIRGEEGIDDIDVKQFPTCNTLADVMECFGTISRSDFGTTVIDSSSTLEPLIHASTCSRCPLKDGKTPASIEKVHGGYSKGYVEALSDWRRITESLDELRRTKNMASIIIGHVKVKRFDDPAGLSYDQWQWDIHDKAASLLYRWCDCILFCHKKTAVTKEDVGFSKTVQKGKDISGGMRFLFTQESPSHPGGGRGVYGRLPEELPLSWEAFQNAITNQLAFEQQQ